MYKLTFFFVFRSFYDLLPYAYIYTCTDAHVQGVRLEPSKSYCSLLPKYEQKGFFKHTGGLPDVVHLMKQASEVIQCPFEIT